MNEKKYHVLMLSDEDKERLTSIANNTIDFIGLGTNKIEEQAFILKMLVESFQDATGNIIPIEAKE